MALAYDPSRPILQGQNIRVPLGTFFNGQSYWITLYPELGRNRSVLVVKMVLQFLFEDGDGGDWTSSEKDTFAHNFVDSVVEVWSEKYRITTTSNVPVDFARDVGVIFEFPYFIGGWHTSDDFEITITKVPSDAGWQVSYCQYLLNNTTLDSNDLRPETKGASMKQRDAVHEFGHMLGLRDEYAAANDNKYHLNDLDSVMNLGEVVRERHYAPFAGWLTNQYSYAAHLAQSEIDYKVEGRINLDNSAL